VKDLKELGGIITMEDMRYVLCAGFLRQKEEAEDTIFY
jgi:hypothetical protein